MSAILSLLQFTTILPLGKPQDFRNSWLYPLAGYVIGCLAAVPALFIADHTIGAAVAVALVLLISGAHHFDGLLDLGDGLMAHGDQEKRVRALTDRQVGAGGVAAGIVTTLLLFAGLQASFSLAAAIITG
jgi:adenosylcobinamide-GDP ribazoletransferase